MRNGDAMAIALEDASQIGEARRIVVGLAVEAGFDESARSDIGIVTTEAATNVIRHAGSGVMLVRELDDASGPGLEVLCVDRGPGMHDLEGCLRDGASSRGTLGGGFGAMRRLAHAFSVYSSPGIGTAVLCRFWRGVRARSPVAAPPIAGLAIPMPGESACGDAWALAPTPAGTTLLVADGLGHGAAAQAAADAAVRIFREHASLRPEELLVLLHAGLRSTRGAAVAVAAVDTVRREVRFAGVGNIHAALVTAGASRHLVSHNGTIGHQLRKAEEFVYPWEEGALLVLHSDGLATHWRMEQYPGLFRQDPAIVAAVLYRDHARGRDDATVVVCRLGGERRA